MRPKPNMHLPRTNRSNVAQASRLRVMAPSRCQLVLEMSQPGGEDGNLNSDVRRRRQSAAGILPAGAGCSSAGRFTRRVQPFPGAREDCHKLFEVDEILATLPKVEAARANLGLCSTTPLELIRFPQKRQTMEVSRTTAHRTVVGSAWLLVEPYAALK